MPKLFLGLLLLLTFFLPAQETRVSRYELAWAVFHPFAAIRVKLITKRCAKNYDQENIFRQLDRFSSGGRADAFRHIYYMAAYSQKIRPRKIRKLGKAHERSNYRQFKKHGTEYGELPDSLSSVMDLTNNETGIRIGRENKKTDLTTLSDMVIKTILDGEAVILKRNADGKFVTCTGEVIDREKYRGQWFIPKCLVSSALH